MRLCLRKHGETLGPFNLRTAMFRRKKVTMEIALSQLSDAFRKKEPACGACGYDAEWVLRLGSLDRLFCEGCLVNALLDAMNFAFKVPSTV